MAAEAGASDAEDPWGSSFRALWRAARPAGRRRTAQLAVGLPPLGYVAERARRMPLLPTPTPEQWAASVRDDGTFRPTPPGAGPRGP